MHSEVHAETAAASTLSFELHVEGTRVHTPRLSLALTIPHGTTVLFGPSGAGKSTCLLALAGLIRPAHGRVQLRGRTLFDSDSFIDVPAEARRVALVFQTLALFSHLSVRDNVAFGIPPRFRGRERSDRSVHWLERMHVATLASRRTETLSGGEAQRVALARALASEPELLLLDEPFSALDHALRQALSREVVAVIAELGIPALLVTHDRDDAQALGERIVSLRAGRLDGV